eukprot:gnl/TRDRNA2_/TRDRNA2_160338_c0_seq1.p1 gnl/TRDRNA2_/TRDRNA2_160338_c0~~gnl/TRDRNA2_/TRDRNA2_160338_c0_seq1.p1  ORF type:complete len:375 (+),score=65.58 gnl/TRDRNA2_/TRDRNA2_160338_c0_seq1:82-1125(+)
METPVASKCSSVNGADLDSMSRIFPGDMLEIGTEPSEYSMPVDMVDMAMDPGSYSSTAHRAWNPNVVGGMRHDDDALQELLFRASATVKRGYFRPPPRVKQVEEFAPPPPRVVEGDGDEEDDDGEPVPGMAIEASAPFFVDDADRRSAEWEQLANPEQDAWRDTAGSFSQLAGSTARTIDRQTWTSSSIGGFFVAGDDPDELNLRFQGVANMSLTHFGAGKGQGKGKSKAEIDRLTVGGPWRPAGIANGGRLNNLATSVARKTAKSPRATIPREQRDPGFGGPPPRAKPYSLGEELDKWADDHGADPRVRKRRQRILQFYDVAFAAQRFPTGPPPRGLGHSSSTPHV